MLLNNIIYVKRNKALDITPLYRKTSMHFRTVHYLKITGICIAVLIAFAGMRAVSSNHIENTAQNIIMLVLGLISFTVIPVFLLIKTIFVVYRKDFLSSLFLIVVTLFYALTIFIVFSIGPTLSRVYATFKLKTEMPKLLALMERATQETQHQVIQASQDWSSNSDNSTQLVYVESNDPDAAFDICGKLAVCIQGQGFTNYQTLRFSEDSVELFIPSMITTIKCSATTPQEKLCESTRGIPTRATYKVERLAPRFFLITS